MCPNTATIASRAAMAAMVTATLLSNGSLTCSICSSNSSLTDIVVAPSIAQHRFWALADCRKTLAPTAPWPLRLASGDCDGTASSLRLTSGDCDGTASSLRLASGDCDGTASSLRLASGDCDGTTSRSRLRSEPRTSVSGVFFRSGTLIEVDIPLGRRLVGMLAGYLQHFVKLLVEHIVMGLLTFHRLLEGVLAAPGFGLVKVHGGLEIGDRGRSDVLLEADDGLGLRIDVQLGLAARASDGNQFHGLRHRIRIVY